MEQLQKLESLAVALLDVIRDSRYDSGLRAALRVAYDSVEAAVCGMQTEAPSHSRDGNSTYSS